MKTLNSSITPSTPHTHLEVPHTHLPAETARGHYLIGGGVEGDTPWGPRMSLQRTDALTCVDLTHVDVVIAVGGGDLWPEERMRGIEWPLDCDDPTRQHHQVFFFFFIRISKISCKSLRCFYFIRISKIYCNSLKIFLFRISVISYYSLKKASFFLSEFPKFLIICWRSRVRISEISYNSRVKIFYRTSFLTFSIFNYYLPVNNKK